MPVGGTALAKFDKRFASWLNDNYDMSMDEFKKQSKRFQTDVKEEYDASIEEEHSYKNYRRDRNQKDEW